MVSLRVATEKQKRTNRQAEGLWTGKIFWLGLALIFVFCYYLFNVNNLATAGYQIKDLEKEIKKVKSNHDQLKIKLSEVRSIELLTQEAGQKKMIKPDRVDYLSLSAAESLAWKK